MAEKTRSKHQQEVQNQLETQQNEILELKTNVSTVKNDVQEIKDMLRTLFAQPHNPPPPPINPEMPLEVENPDPRKFNLRGVKLDFPHFLGVNPAAWLFKVNHYFEFHQTPLAQRLLMASYHMEGDALVWFQNAVEGGFCRDWDTFCRSSLLRFGPTAYDDPMEALTRLKQTSSVVGYMAEFERLSNRLRGLSDLHKLSCFLSGLKDEIRIPIRMLNPVNLNGAYGLAKMQEEYHTNTKKFHKPMVEKIATPREGNPYSKDNYSKWKQPGEVEDEEGKQASEKEEENQQIQILSSSKDELEISLAAIAGTPTMRTMRLVGRIKGEQVVILLDSGSSHNFIDTSLASKLQLPVDYLVNLKVRVANGQGLNSEGLCRTVQLKVQGNVLQLPLHLLELAGCDIVLGVQWLETLGPIMWDFSKLLMSFMWKGKTIEFKGLKLSPSVVEDSEKTLKATIAKGKGMFLQIMCEKGEETDCEKMEEQFSELLEGFCEVFNESQGLPPPRNHDHHIILKEGTQPITNRPYRYPHYQKIEIENIVAELLKSGVIRPSSSPFSSPVLLVCKVDGSWRLCVDYRALNRETVKAKFPIPVIDELLDELFGAVIFSKLDL
ncbi:hypothetical protein F2P56_024094 [Juglans regia]|uniref:Uncharacterized protein LOC108999318 n=2 Tax=Juglans regia TaxID=51240 RepID=A0A2I4FJC5_JUGRE|nr:uncharacterized protein LOC108999318 [Juglans regia]KAF5454428.1 hypothetical protein F2P56_024094 [Juglans regia]